MQYILFNLYLVFALNSLYFLSEIEHSFGRSINSFVMLIVIIMNIFIIETFSLRLVHLDAYCHHSSKYFVRNITFFLKQMVLLNYFYKSQPLKYSNTDNSNKVQTIFNKLNSRKDYSLGIRQLFLHPLCLRGYNFYQNISFHLNIELFLLDVSSYLLQGCSTDVVGIQLKNLISFRNSAK